MFVQGSLDSDLDSVVMVLQAAVKSSLKYKSDFMKIKM